MDQIQIEPIAEHLLSPAQQREIAQLLNTSFPGYPAERTYYMQLPHFRFLASFDQQLIGHLAVTHRMINAGGDPARIFGLGDLCIHQSYQQQKIGSLLMKAVEEEALLRQLDFLVLVTDEQEFYLSKGFSPLNNLCRWVSIRNHETFGIVQGRLSKGLLIKSVSGKKWGDGVVDLLGYMF